MKYIKKYESISVDLKKYDLILNKSNSFYDYELYILLENVPKNKRKLNVLHIAELSFDSNYIDFEIVNVDEELLYKDVNIRILNDKEKTLLFNLIEEEKINPFKHGIKETLIKNLDYDITLSEDYEKFLLKKNAKKYNL